MSWRFVDSDLVLPARSAAIDEAILTARNEGLVPDTLHLYRRSVPTISLGHFEKVEECVNLEVAKSRGVQLVRRMSGGSAIYTDQGQLVISATLGRSSVPSAPEQTFRLFCQGIIGCLGSLGLKAEFKPINDVQVNGRKISGSAQVRRWNVVLLHGTLIVDTDYDLMFRVLRRSKREREQMTSLAAELPSPPDLASVKKAVVEGFAEAFRVHIEAGQLTEKELMMADTLEKNKYGTADHTYLR